MKSERESLGVGHISLTREQASEIAYQANQRYPDTISVSTGRGKSVLVLMKKEGWPNWATCIDSDGKLLLTERELAR